MNTRRDALGAAAVALAALAARAEPSAAKGEDTGLLELMVGYQHTVVFQYHVVLRNARLTGHERATLTRFRGEAEQAAAALRGALVENGGRAAQPPRAADAKLPADVLHKTTRERLLRQLVRSEENAASGWYACLQQLRGPRLLGGSAAFMAAGGRRLVVLRDLAGVPLLPHAFESGTP